jgi:hypothetical protein
MDVWHRSRQSQQGTAGEEKSRREDEMTVGTLPTGAARGHEPGRSHEPGRGPEVNATLRRGQHAQPPAQVCSAKSLTSPGKEPYITWKKSPTQVRKRALHHP